MIAAFATSVGVTLGVCAGIAIAYAAFAAAITVFDWLVSK